MKYIYLDQNKWIELAKGLKECNQRYEDLYKSIKGHIEDCSWAFPLSLVHIEETLKRKDITSRNNLFDLMFSVSKGWAICDYITAENFEFNNWINNNGKVDLSELKTLIVRRDWANIVGLSSEDILRKDLEQNLKGASMAVNQEKLNRIMWEPQNSRMLFDMMCNSYNDESINENEFFFYETYIDSRDKFLLWKEEIKNLDEYKDRHLYPAYLIQLFFNTYKERINGLTMLQKYKINNIFEDNSKNKTMATANLESLPGFNVYNRLIFELFNNPDKGVHKHDFNDLAYLRIAIPYCDIVIGEKYWCNRVQHYKLDKKYNTVVTTSIFDLLDIE